MSACEGLFENLPEQGIEPPPASEAAVRLRLAQGDQPEFQVVQVVELDSLLAWDHPARAVWALVETPELSDLLAGIKSRVGEPSRPPADPKILMTLWLYTTIEGVGSARELARLCEAHVAYRWICGGVSMNYHTLADFRVGQVKLLDRLLAQGITALVSEGLVKLERLAQDGVRIRASAGSSSYRGRSRLEELLTEAEKRVEQLKAELDADPAASTARRRAARERAAREQVERTKAALDRALDRMQQLEAERARREKTHQKETAKPKPPRASTTDAEARVMKMADGGYRPAYNGQFASDPRTQVIVAVDLETTGLDGGLTAPMQDRIAGTYGRHRSSIWRMAASASWTTSSAHMPPASKYSRRCRTTSTRPIPLLRARAMVRGQRHGANGWTARRARRCIASAPSTSAAGEVATRSVAGEGRVPPRVAPSPGSRSVAGEGRVPPRVAPSPGSLREPTSPASGRGDTRWASIPLDRPRVMGVLNITPDSFSDGGAHFDPERAIAAGLAMAKAGADIIDVGGESTRPLSLPTDPAEERARIIPIIAALAAAGLPVSVDTRNAATMAAALDAGARIVNDVSALTHDPAAAPLVAERGCPVVLMHMRGVPATMMNFASYADIAAEVAAELAERIDAARQAGIRREQIALDPGIGFAKHPAQSVELLRRLPELAPLRFPIVVGVSRKGFIGRLTGVPQPRDRLAGSLAAGLFAVARGASILRVHDVSETVQALHVWHTLATD